MKIKFSIFAALLFASPLIYAGTGDIGRNQAILEALANNTVELHVKYRAANLTERIHIKPLLNLLSEIYISKQIALFKNSSEANNRMDTQNTENICSVELNRQAKLLMFSNKLNQILSKNTTIPNLSNEQIKQIKSLILKANSAYDEAKHSFMGCLYNFIENRKTSQENTVELNINALESEFETIQK